MEICKACGHRADRPNGPLINWRAWIEQELLKDIYSPAERVILIRCHTDLDVVGTQNMREKRDYEAKKIRLRKQQETADKVVRATKRKVKQICKAPDPNSPTALPAEIVQKLRNMDVVIERQTEEELIKEREAAALSQFWDNVKK